MNPKPFPLLAALALLLLAPAACFWGCSDEPTDVGRGLLPASDTLRVESREFVSTFDTTFLVPVAANTGRLLVGKHDDLEAASLVEFGGVPAFSSSQRVDSASITFRINYFFTDSTGVFGLTAFTMSRGWTASTFRWDSLALAASDTVAGQFAGSLVPRDTAISLKVDTAVIRRWGAAGGTGSLALRAAANVIGSNLVAGFLNSAGSAFRPLLTVSYRDSAADTTIRFTSLATRGVSVVHVNTASGIPSSSGDVMMLQAGAATRSIVRFDSLAIPAKASITDAQLVLTLNPSSSLANGYSRDSLIASWLRGAAYPYDTVSLGTVCSPARDSAARKIYQGPVKAIVQQWISGRPNRGFVLQAYGEFPATTLDRFAIYNTAAIPSSLRPRLKVTYTVFP